jgi:hypothetical protein
MTADFKRLWADGGTPNRERKRMLDLIIEDATLIKLPAEGITKVHLRFKGGKTQTITTLNRRSSAQQVKTQPRVVEVVDRLLDEHTYAEIAELLNEQGSKGYVPAEPFEPDVRTRASLPSEWAISYTPTACVRSTSVFVSGACSPRQKRQRA